tara:strand:+ start:159 stop:1634 length:1476 start_codon:yes stop_codon:yes gene_type:complete
MKLTVNQLLEKAIIANQHNNLDEAERFYQKILEIEPAHLVANNNLAVILQFKDKLDEAEFLYQKIIETQPTHPDANHNLGALKVSQNKIADALPFFKIALEGNSNIEQYWISYIDALVKDNKLEEAETISRKAIKLKPEFIKVHFNLGFILNELKKPKEAEVIYKKTITLKPEFVEAHNNLGLILKDLGRLDEAKSCYEKAIELKPDFAEIYNNLGEVQHLLRENQKAKSCYEKAIALKPNLDQAYNNLGTIFKDLKEYEKAKSCYEKAIELKPDFNTAHSNLDVMLKQNELLLIIKQTIKQDEKNKTDNLISSSKLNINQFTSYRSVESELINKLYKINATPLDKLEKDPRYGNGRSSDYKLFENDCSIIKTVSKDLINIMKQTVKSDIYIMESFFNILSAGSALKRHCHITDFDKFHGLNNQKYSLTYYLSIGDQNCNEPGVLTLYDPEEKILPTEGMIMIFPADRMHSVVYDGKIDRIMIGVNFYSII